MNLFYYKKIFQQNRLNQYKDIISLALKQDYIVTSLIDWYENYKEKDVKVLILRHDVDYDYQGAYQMYMLEKSMGVKSTYYFRWLSVNKPIMKKMKDDDFEVSLHYETLATYAKENKIINKEAITADVLDMCYNKLEDEIRHFESSFGKIKTICSHGDKVNRLIKVSNYKIINYKKLEELGILLNTYNPEIIKKFDAYISDSSIYNNFAWKHDGNPNNALLEGKKNICLLTHPIHWNQSFIKNIKLLFTVYIDNMFYLKKRISPL
ncbi:MAG: hypothetical protein DRI86_13260 [Bacteroidetes bacterium]|nr:MAG: hypothetical protein DRI86_13260 [Bacteroidota bacterium]